MRTASLGIAVAAATAAMLVATSARALVFEPIERDGKSILLIRDGDSAKPQECAPRVRGVDPFCGFALGDGEALRELLRRRQFAEIWLASGGGVLIEGIAVGRAIREHSLASGRLIPVRIRDGHRCISSCTVAYLGGLERHKDPGGTYEVHSGSRYQGLTVQSQLPTVQRDRMIPATAVLADPEKLFIEVAKGTVVAAMGVIPQLVDYFLDMHVNVLESRARRSSNPRAILDMIASDFRDPAALADDVLTQAAAEIRVGGIAVLQKRLMDVERSTINEVIRVLDANRDKLGRFANRAIDNVRIMYGAASIVWTGPLPEETMREFHYLRRYQ